METFLTDFRGGVFELPVLTAWKFSYGAGLPCDAFEICFAYDKSMLSLLSEAVRFRAVFEGKTVFVGPVDEFEVRAGEKGCLASIRGRSLAALLLDNEAEAAQYFSAGLDTILERYVLPWGISDIRKNASPRAQALVVASGSSCWRVLEDFLWFGCGVKPRFSREGVLLLGETPGERLAIDGSCAVFEAVLKEKRYGVISEALVKNKALGTVNRVENAEFIQRGGHCRRVVNVPRNTRFDTMRSTGEYQIARSREEEMMLSLSLPTLFGAFPGDVIQLSGTALGLEGSFFVGRSCCFADGEGAGTEIILTRRVE
ncbi:MAG: hypothetical protein RR731_01110 [Oscillospiraceae bacterium]